MHFGLNNKVAVLHIPNGIHKEAADAARSII